MISSNSNDEDIFHSSAFRSSCPKVLYSSVLNNCKANHLVANAGKCHLLTSSNLPVDIRITNTKISNMDRVKLLGVNFEGRHNFDYHVNTLLKKANKK